MAVPAKRSRYPRRIARTRLLFHIGLCQQELSLRLRSFLSFSPHPPLPFGSLILRMHCVIGSSFNPREWRVAHACLTSLFLGGTAERDDTIVVPPFSNFSGDFTSPHPRGGGNTPPRWATHTINPPT